VRVSQVILNALVVKPKFHPWPFPGDEHRFDLGALIALLAVGAVVVSRAILGMILLPVDRAGA
jgi:hypothetical protein